MSVQEALTPEARILIIERFSALSPSHWGIQAADVLAFLLHSGSHPDLVEPYWETQGKRLCHALDGRATLVGCAARAAAMLLEPGNFPPDRYANLVNRIAWAAAEGKQDAVGIPQ